MQALPGPDLDPVEMLSPTFAVPGISLGHGTDLILILTHLKAGTPSTEIDDLSTTLYKKESKRSFAG